jgi:hypothetical protein
MADETNQSDPTTEDFPSYDEVESDEGQAELSYDSFDEAAVSDNEIQEGCCG